MDKPSKKKIPIPISDVFKTYLASRERLRPLKVDYADLTRYITNIPLLDFEGQDTLWQTVFYQEYETQELHEALKEVYAMLKMDGDFSALPHLTIDRIDYCLFGNTNPFRIRIKNQINDNYDYFYVKKIDASRLYGLELEVLLSPNFVNYFCTDQTLVEEHVAGIPGDDFMKGHIHQNVLNDIRISKEFVKFNERCFVRLLGDMRSYNYVVDITPDIDGNQYRLRAIDFDQQSYEGKKSFYLPQYFKDNNPIIFLGIQHMKPDTVKQYQLEERSLIARRAKNNRDNLNRLLQVMRSDALSTSDKIEKLRIQLADHHKNKIFEKCQNMGDIVLTNIQLVIQKEFKQSIIVQDL